MSLSNSDNVYWMQVQVLKIDILKLGVWPLRRLSQLSETAFRISSQ